MMGGGGVVVVQVVVAFVDGGTEGWMDGWMWIWALAENLATNLHLHRLPHPPHTRVLFKNQKRQRQRNLITGTRGKRQASQQVVNEAQAIRRPSFPLTPHLSVLFCFVVQTLG